MATATAPHTTPGKRERRRWLLLVLLLIAGFGGLTMTGILYTDRVEQRGRAETQRVQEEQQRDLCELIAALLPTGGPAPATTYGQQQRAAVVAYREHRC